MTPRPQGPKTWAAFGFSRNPYDTHPVPPSDDGDFLLVGREAEVADLMARLTSGTTIPLLVGNNGVGKTSIVSVAAYRLSAASVEDGPRYLALDPPLQLDSVQTRDRFVRDAYHRIAKVLLDERELLLRSGVKRGEIKALRRWLRDPEAKPRAFGLSTPFGGINWQTGGEASSSDGFTNFGMPAMIDDWLGRCFADQQSGGIVCLIDNLEILNTSAQAREAVEALRDGLFVKPGLRWVLCGTPAVVGGAALFSSRMEGRISPPVSIEPLPLELAPELVTRRLQRFGSPEAYAPVDGEGFERIYAVVRSRLRYALDLCQEFAFFLATQTQRRPMGAVERLEVLDDWLAQKASEFAEPAAQVPARSWRLFEDLTDLGGEISGHQADMCRFETAEDLAIAAAPLIRAGLLERTETDQGDYVLQATTPGWLVRFQRRGFEL
jgi:hypothetical protein